MSRTIAKIGLHEYLDRSIMALEIERKFLLKKNFAWDSRFQSLPHENITQGYFLGASGKTVRVRLVKPQDGSPAIGVLTLKTKISHRVRNEFEYEIPARDATELLRLCQKGLSKIRYYYDFCGNIWTVDVFNGPLAGLKLAEIELDDPDADFKKPKFIGKEVTESSKYKNSALAAAGFLLI